MSNRISAVALAPPAPRASAEADDCTVCGSTLDTSQPDPERPTRLLGCCTDCGSWFFILAIGRRPRTLTLVPGSAR